MDERAQTILLFILFLAMCLVALYFYSGTRAWHDKYQQLLDTLTAKLVEKDKQIEKLQNEIKAYKDMERVIKVEKVVIQPKEIKCKFTMHDSFIKDQKTFKKVFVSEVGRYVAEELENDPRLYKLYFEKSIYNFNENIIAELRLLPYPEEADWNLKEEDK